jgi:hypothetical protein
MVAGGGDGGAGRRRRPGEAVARGGRQDGGVAARRAGGVRRVRAASAGAGGRGGASAAQGWDRESERRERRRKKPGAKFIFLICRVPAIWHSAKIFFIFKICFVECQIGDTRQRLHCECRPGDTQQRLIYTSLPSVISWHSAKYICIFFCFEHQTFCGLFLHYVDLHVPFGDNYNCVCNI